MPEGVTQLKLIVFDLSGKLLVDRMLDISDDREKAIFRTDGLQGGMYKYILIDQNAKKCSGTFLIR